MAKAKTLTEAEHINQAADLLGKAAEVTRDVRGAKRSIDLDTAETVAANLHGTIAKAHQGLAVIEEIKSVRRRQATSLVDGKRRKGAVRFRRNG